MKEMLLFFTAVFGLLISFLNSFIFEMSPTGRDAYFNNLIHRFSWGLRFLWVLLLIFIGSVTDMYFRDTGFQVIVAIVFFWPLYNVVYNLRHNHGWFYLGSSKSGTKSPIDRFLGGAVLVLQGILLLVALLWYPLDIASYIARFISWLADWAFTDWIFAGMIVIFAVLVSRKFYHKNLWD